MIDFDSQVDILMPQLRVQEPRKSGTLVRLVGLRMEARGIMAPLGACCEVTDPSGHRVEAEVVGFNDQTLYLMPFTEPQGIGPGASVRVVSHSASVCLGNDLLGRVIDGRGVPLDGKPVPRCDTRLALQGRPINPMERGPITQVLDVGVKAINGMLTLGCGQRVGLVAGSGVGKSVLLGMMTRFTQADVVVIGLIGERGREVQAFIEESLGPEGLAKSVVVAAPANVSPVLRLKATLMTHVIAEYFRDQGKNVLMLVDSLTRVAHAQREIGLAVGEPPTSKGYPPSVFALLPTLIERAGVGRHGHGSITAIYTVLAEGDDANDPIVDLARASLDGQVMLSRQLADAAHYPAIDLNGSISRLMPSLLPPDAFKRSNRLRRLWSLYQQSRDLIQVGAYVAGSDADLDQAIRLRPTLEAFLRQDMHAGVSYGECMDKVREIVGD
jgi:flagellum-specific ATP synthase